MKKIILFFVVIPFTFLIFPIMGKCQFVTKDEAGIIAKNWVQMKVDFSGSWGKVSAPQIEPVAEMDYNNNLIAYYCMVKPTGAIIISLRKEFGPVLAYSEVENFQADQEVASDFKSLFAKNIDTLEVEFGPIEGIPVAGFGEFLIQNKSASWNDVYYYIPGSYNAKINIEKGIDDYIQGDTLLDCSWHQGYPYNLNCPDKDCFDDVCYSGKQNALVGCVALAASQIMKYWSWPPYSHSSPPIPIPNTNFDWKNMPNRAVCNATTSEKNAVAYLCGLVADYMYTIYGCDGSMATWAQAQPIYPSNFSYSTTDLMLRIGNTQDDWWNAIVGEIDQGQPIHYFIQSHSVVCDGYEISPNGNRFYHMNWGHDNYKTDFYYLDGLPGGQFWEAMIRDIVPYVALGSTLSGNYPLEDFPYRYFNKDAFNYGSSGVSAIFQPGQYLQFLPEVTAMSTGSSTYLEFQGNAGNNTRLYTNGDTSRGIKISNGAIRHTNGGTVKLYKKQGY